MTNVPTPISPKTRVGSCNLSVSSSVKVDMLKLKNAI